ncbi:MAG: serine/threonine protein kinase [Chloroflexota bacterium]|nr:serine/threonine protein kinase [Chloroflexota bacterium]MDQ5865613.1 serine/threonine protein kinase [Chloroflexota bacterium]
MAFLDELRQKWLSSEMTADEVLDEILRWEEDISARTDQELDDAWTFRQEIEGATDSAVGAPVSTAPPPDSAGATNNDNTDSFTSTHGQEDPWVAVQHLMAQGHWGAAHQVVATIPDYHPRFSEVPRLLEAITDGETYDQVPGLGSIVSQLASARSRRAWDEFNRRFQLAEQLITDASAAAGRAIEMPRSLRAVFEEALRAQESERLVNKAVKQRTTGDFDGALASLDSAADLDPRFARVQMEREVTKELVSTVRRLSTTPQTPIDTPAGASRMRYAIENKFPQPIATAFYQLRWIDDQLAEIPQVANILGACLQHLTIVALAEYLSGNRRDSHLNAGLLERLQKPVSHGTWVGILRDILAHLQEHHHQPFTAELFEFYFPKHGEKTITTLRQMGDELVQMRNDLLKRSADTLPGSDKQGDFKKNLVKFLQMVAFLKDYPLVTVKNTHTTGGTKTHKCYLHMGFHDTFEQVEVQSDLDLENSRVAMLNPKVGELLYLYPFYLLRQCPQPSCGKLHLFRFDQLTGGGKKSVEYITSSGHKLRDEGAPVADLLTLIKSSWAVKLRHKAKYIYIESSESWQRLAVGTRVGGKYEVLQHLRRGGMADVYKVKCIDDGAVLALKLLPFQFLSDYTMVQRFRKEAMQAAELDHPNIARIVDQGEDLVDHYLVMELADGWITADGEVALDVGDLVKPLDQATVFSIIKQACEGLHYIHQQGIVHRDIKPGNLLLFELGRVKLTDFGIARSREEITLTLTGLNMGTPEYMSPEQAEGTKELTPASDIYSLGVVMYEMLTGKSPFKRATPLATMYAHRHDPVPNLAAVIPSVDRSLQWVLMRCLAKDPGRRFRSASELYKQLVAYEQQGTRSSSAEVRYDLPSDEHYQRAWRAEQPGCLLILIDQSASMGDSVGAGLTGAGQRKADFAALVVNKLLYELVQRCTVGTDVRPRVDVAVLGYGPSGGVQSVWSGALANRDLVSISEVASNPLRIAHSTATEFDPDSGRLVQIPIGIPIWMEPLAGNGTPMCRALQVAHSLAQEWTSAHVSSFPPIVVNIADGEPTDGDPLPYAAQLGRVGTEDGKALVFNCFLSSSPGYTVRYPRDISQLPPEPLAQQFFQMSSILPHSMIRIGNSVHGMGLQPGARGFVFGGDIHDLTQFVTIASLPALSRW